MSDSPVVLIHGFGTSYKSTWVDNGWTALLEDAGRRVIGVDLLGHGDAEKPEDPYEYDNLESVALEAFPSEPVDAIGFSMGATVLLHLALQAPDRFKRLVVAGIGSNLFEKDENFRESIVEAVKTGAASTPELRYFAQLPEAPNANRPALAAFLQRPNPPKISKYLLASLKIPVLVVIGENDFTYPADELIESLPNSKLVVLPKTDHFATPKNFTFIDSALTFLEAQPF